MQIDPKDFLNLKFNQWTVISYEGKKNERHWYKTKCSCGNESILERNILKRGKSSKCRSCARKISCNSNKNPAYKHGYSSVNHSHYNLYNIWIGMKSRCYRKSDSNYKIYGGRGITVCKEWLDSFENFLNDMGYPKKGESLDRINVNGNYYPDNCRWANKETQANNCRTNIHYQIEDEKLSETQCSRKLGISRNKMMYWARKKGIEWVIKNKDLLLKTKPMMTNKELKELGLELRKGRTKLGAYKKESDLFTTVQSYRSMKCNYRKKEGVFTWKTFEEFYKDMGKKPKNTRLMRKDKDKPFSKENCYWG